MENETILQQVPVTGSGNTVLTLGKVGRDVHIGDTQVVADSQFFDLALAELKSEPAFDSPPADRLILLLARERMLILAGPLANKGECARDLAFRLGQRLGSDQKAEVTVRERWRGQEAQRLESAVSGEGPTILLLPEISKSQLAGYGPVNLLRLLHARDAYAIITTEGSRENWNIGEGGYPAQLWHELSAETFYGYTELARFLKLLLVDSDRPVPEGLLPGLPDSALLIEGLPLVAAAEMLKSPENVRFFARTLLQGTKPPSRHEVEALLAELAGNSEAVRGWYEQLAPHDQLLAVGLVLFDGLPDDLLFAGLELLVETTWRGTDPLLAQFDYIDLTRFAAYFKERRVEGGFVRIESGSRERRQQILEAAWRHQRRRLLATLPALTQMIRVSAAESAAPAGPSGPAAPSRPSGDPATVASSAARALGRTESGSVQLHQVLAESLSLISLLSIDMVEPYLLDLAADPSESVQQLVASALAAWRGEEGRDEKLFELLQRWWSEACDVGDQGSRIARAARLGPDPWAAVRAAVALAVGYAVQYDREGHLAPVLQGLLTQLLIDPHPRVRQVVERFTLRRAVTWHFREIESLIRTRALSVTEYIGAVARGAALACEMSPEACLPILDSWRTLAHAEPDLGDGAVGHREILLATVALTWGYIQCDEGQPRLSGAAVTSQLRSLVTDESHPFVRHHAFFAIEIQTQRNFALAAPLLQTLLERVNLADRPAMVELAVRTYLHQRQQLRGGDRRIEVDGRSYPIWMESTRPLTGLEASLYGWILDDTRPGVQQLAVGIFAAMSDTGLDREENRLRAAAPDGASLVGGRSTAGPRANRAGGRAPRAPHIRRLAVLGHLAVLLAAPRKKELRPILKPLLAEVIFERLRLPRIPGSPAPRRQALPPATAGMAPRAGNQRIEALLKRWTDVRNQATNAIAAYLRQALAFYRWRWALVLAATLLMVGSYELGKRGLAAWGRHLAAASSMGAPAAQQPTPAPPN